MKYPLIIGIHNKIRFEIIIIKKPISQLLVSYLETALYINIIWPRKIAIIIRTQKYTGYILYIEKPYTLGACQFRSYHLLLRNLHQAAFY